MSIVSLKHINHQNPIFFCLCDKTGVVPAQMYCYIICTHQSALGHDVVGYGPFSLSVIHMEGLCPGSGDINRLIMMMMV
jgi:hypothetical protein